MRQESIYHSRLAINISYKKKENRRKGNENLMSKSVFFPGVCASEFEDQQKKNEIKRESNRHK